jgi:hypothetical protein
MAIKTVAAPAAHLAPTSLDGLKVERTPWHDCYNGTKTALINAGLLEDGMFPGDPDRGKTMVTYKPDGTAARQGSSARKGLQVCRRGRSVYVVRVAVSAEETERRLAERKAKSERERELKELRALPQTQAGFLRHGADVFWEFVTVARFTLMNEARFGFRVDDDTLEEFMDAAGNAYWAIRNGGAVGKSPRVKLRNLQFAEAQRNGPLQTFLERVRGGEA